LTSPTLYRGQELEAMAVAANYYRWLLATCRSHLGRIVLEHGAGTGTFSTALLGEPIEHLVALEPALNLLPALRARLAPWGPRASVRADTLEQYAASPDRRTVDSIVSVNVLEHIADDRATLAAMAHILPAGGRLVVFVPALPWLYGTLDAGMDHVRRYGAGELRDKVRAAGFAVSEVRFMNLVGVLTWFVAGRVLRQRTLARASVRLFDRCVVPLVRALESRRPPPVGQSLLLLARKPAGGP
jgi:SAM-dependent methyltransferase